MEKSSNILLQMGQNWQKSIFLATFSPNNKNWGVAELQVVLLVGLTKIVTEFSRICAFLIGPKRLHNGVFQLYIIQYNYSESKG